MEDLVIMTKLLIVLLTLSASFVLAQEGSYSYYNYFHDEPALNGFYVDGHYFGGPFRVNGPVRLYSSSPGRDNDPYFYSLTLSSDYYLYGSSTVQVSVPHYENLWIEPYEMMEQGAPWFNLGVDPLPFGATSVEWQTVRAAAISYGLFLTDTEVPDGSRILIEDGQLSVKTSESSQPVVYTLSGLSENVVWIDNSPGDKIFLKGHPDSQGFSEELTIGTEGDIYFAGPLEYNGAIEGMLGLISVYGDGVIAHTPSYTDWEVPYQIETEESFVYSASILLLEGKLYSENYFEPNPIVDFTLYGGIQMREEGYTSTGSSGFDLNFEYDERLFNQCPPWYPQYETSSVESSSPYPLELEFGASCNPIFSSVSLSLSEPGQITIFDSSGRVIESVWVNAEWFWNSSSLPSGIYVLHASGESGTTSSMRLVKL